MTPDSPTSVRLSELEHCIDQHGDSLFRYAKARVNDAHAAEDLVQQTFVSALNAYHRFTKRASLKSWLTGILRHKILDHYRRKARNPIASATSLDGSPPDFDEAGRWREDAAPADWAPNPEETLKRKEFMALFERCLERLPPNAAQAFILREIEGLSSQEVAEIMGLSQSHLWVLMHRSRRLLRKEIEKNWPTAITSVNSRKK